MDDKGAIVAAVKDYWEGWFDGDPERMRRALHPALAKTRVGTDASGLHDDALSSAEEQRNIVTESMTAADMIGWTREGEGVARKPADFAYDITINDFYHQIATVTVRSAIYREYLHLVRTPDGWKILNALYMTVLEEQVR